MNNEQRLLMLRLSQSNMKLAIIYLQLLRLWVACRRQMRWWGRRWISLRPEQGAYGNLMMLLRNEDVVAFRNFTRLSPRMFLEWVEQLMPKLRKEDTWYRDWLEVGLNLAITLRHLATEDNYKPLMYIFYVPHNTISILVRDVCQAIWDEYGDEVVSSPTTAEGWKEIVASYSNRWNFHHALGALDGKHIHIRCPANGGSQFYNYKGYHSFVLLALFDANYRFRGPSWSPKAAAGVQLWNESTLRDAVITNSIDIPQQEPLPGDDWPIPYFITGDNAFVLNEWLMKPWLEHLWNRTSRSLIIAFLAPDDVLRMPLAYWPIAGAAYSQPFYKKSRRL